MYNIKKDPGQLANLLYGKVSSEVLTEAKRLHAKLKEKLDHTNALPEGFAWPTEPF
jgi:hypothetical protein